MHKSLSITFLLMLSACIGTDILDDAVEPEVVILNPVTSIQVGTTYAFMAQYRNMTGKAEDVSLTWTSSDPTTIAINTRGEAKALKEGSAELRVSANSTEAKLTVEAGAATSGEVTLRTAVLYTSSSYPLSGTANLIKTDNGLLLQFEDDFSTTSDLPGLYVYLSNNTSTTNNAYEVGMVTAFTGEQVYEITDLDDILAYKYVLFFCKPFVVPVGDGELDP